MNACVRFWTSLPQESTAPVRSRPASPMPIAPLPTPRPSMRQALARLDPGLTGLRRRRRAKTLSRCSRRPGLPHRSVSALMPTRSKATPMRSISIRTDLACPIVITIWWTANAIAPSVPGIWNLPDSSSKRRATPIRWPGHRPCSISKRPLPGPCGTARSCATAI
jgi:hypothetical protein